jgi:hypothetical protein
MMRYRMLVAVAVYASTVLVACGAAESNSAQVETVAHHYFAALGNGNGSELCSLLTGETKQRLIRSGSVVAALAHRSNTPGCPEIVTAVHETLGSDQLAELRRVKVSVHSLSGNNASVRVTVPKTGRTVLVPMTKTEAGWLVSGVQLQTGLAEGTRRQGFEEVSVMCWVNEHPVAKQQPPACDIFGEPEIDANLVRLSGAKWSEWGASESKATAQLLPNHEGTGVPPKAVQVTLSNIQNRCDGKPFYTQLHIVGSEGAPNLVLSGACESIPLG